MTSLRQKLDALLARKLVVAFVVGFVGAFADTIAGVAQSAQPLSTSVLVGAAAGAFAAAVRALLALGPVNVVPSDATHTLTGAARRVRVAPHPHLGANATFAGMKLGRGPVRRDGRTLQLARYLTAALPAPPPLYDLSQAVAAWPMYGNDTLGDCTCAAVGHMIEAWTAAAGVLKTLTTAAIERLYWETGTPPRATGRPGGPTDDGRVELDVLNYWRKTGVSRHHITAYTEVSPSNQALMKAAIWLFGGVYVGIALPLTAQTQQVWDVVGDGKTGRSAPGSWGGHAINIVAYDADGLVGVTWGGLIRVTWRFVDAYFEEAYAVIAKDWLNAKGETPAGFDLTALETDLKQVTA